MYLLVVSGWQGWKYFSCSKRNLLFTFCFLFFALADLRAQTPGFIYTPASNGGNKVLDPNGDGYVSISTRGFVGGDVGSDYSEIPYRTLPQFGTEPLTDLVTGSGGGHTDLAQPPMAMYFNGQNIYFRIRMGGSSTASKGYSYLFDTDGIFYGQNAETGGTIPYKNPSSVKNPGFEYEVVLASNFDVRIYKHNGSGDTDEPYSATLIWQGNLNTYSQRAVAFTTEGGNPDYFYDFYTPLTAFQGGITAATKMRVTGSTVTSAQSGLTGTISDVGGLDDRLYNNDPKTIWKQVVPAFPRTSLTELQNGEFGCAKSLAPVISSTIKQYDTSVSGNSSEANGTIIKVYSGGTVAANGSFATTGTLIGTGTVSNGTWTVSVSPAIALGNVIRATATSVSPQKCESNPSASVTATSNFCNTTPPPNMTIINGGQTGKGFTGTYTIPTGTPVSNTYTFKLYKILSNGTVSNNATELWTGGLAGDPVSATVSPSSTSSTSVSWRIENGVKALSSGSYTITVSINGGCESNAMDPATCVGTGTTPNPTITTTYVDKTATTADVVGSIVANATTNITIGIYRKDGITLLKSVVITSPVSGQTYPFTITLTQTELSQLVIGGELIVRSVTGTNCRGVATQRVAVKNGKAATPTITTALCLPASGSSTFTVSGTSPEPGATIVLTNNGTVLTTTPSTVLVNGSGLWSATVTATAPFSIRAQAKYTNKIDSDLSPVANITSQAVNTAANGIDFYSSNYTTLISSTNFIYEGTGANGAVYGKVPVPANTKATVKVYLNKDRLASDVNIVIENTNASTTTNNWALTGLSPQELFVGGLVTATVTYTAIGAGGTNSCESNHITPGGGDPYSGGTVTLYQYDYVQCQTAPVDRTITWQANGTICFGSRISATITNPESGVLYQMQRDGVNTGDPVVGAGNSIIVYSAAITSTTSGTLRIVATKNNTSSCQTVLTSTKSISGYTLTTALTTPTITLSATTVCKNGAVTVTVTNPAANGSYQLFRNGVAFGNAVLTGTTAPASIPFQSGTLQINTDFYVVFTNNSGCTATSATSSVTVKGPSLTRPVSINRTSSCTSPSAITISVGTENNSLFTYQVVQVSGPTGSNVNVGNSFTGDGSVKTISTSLSTSGTYVFKVTVTDASTAACGTQNLTTQVTTSVSQSPAAANAYTPGGTPAEVSKNPLTLAGSDPAPGTGQWTITSQPAGSAAYFSDATRNNAQVYNLVSGSYTFQWRVTNTCNNTSTTSSVTYTVTANTPATYSVASPDYVNNYATDELLADPFDPDGFNTTGNNFALKSGSALPPGTSLNLTTGKITVTSPSSLVAGTYNLNILATDKTTSTAKTTDVPITLTFYQPASKRTLVAILPVELLYFNGQMANGEVTLSWATATEKNNQYFMVERSSDGINFLPIGQVAGYGNSSSTIKYSFTDKSIKSKIQYYRLRQVDFDYKFEYSKIIVVKTNGINVSDALEVYPNPTNKEVKVVLQNNANEPYTLEIRNLTGQVVYRPKELISPDHQTVLNLESLPTGTYLLIARYKDKHLIKRIIKL